MGRTDRQTDKHTGQTGSHLMPFCYSSNRQGHKMQELSSLFMTYHLNVMHAPVKINEYILYSLGVMAWTWFIIWN